jgi:hypothetical protein
LVILPSFGGMPVVFVAFVFDRGGKDQQADAGYVVGFCGQQVFGALAQLRHADVGIAAQFEAGGD